MKKILNYSRLFLTAAIVITLDQWTKMLVRKLALGDTWLPQGMEWLEPYARIVHWYNTGAAFGTFAEYGWVFTVLAFIVAGLIIYYYPQVEDTDWWLKLAMGMQMGGALGNVVDRLTNNGQVTDFISVGNFAVFNIADASITMGVVVLLIGIWFKEQSERKIIAQQKQKQDSAESGTTTENENNSVVSIDQNLGENPGE